jgi:hypothetical protein
MQVTNITGIVPVQKTTYENIKNQPIDKQRFQYFKGSLYVWTEDTRAESDTHIYWASNHCKPKWNNKTGLYLKRDSTFGCTYEKATKFKWWFGKQATTIGSLILSDMCNYFRVEWFNSIPVGLQNSTTNTNMNKVLLGKITNPRDLIKAIIKTNPTMRGMNISTELVWDYLNKNQGYRIQSLADTLSVAKDPNHAIEYVISKYVISNGATVWDMQDLIKQAQMLGRKVDFKWSTNRVKEVHQDWTREIMDIEQETVESIDYHYINELPHNGHLELITNSKDLYVEGRMMSHCVYTNYNTQVADKSYFVLKFTDREVRATVGISKTWMDDDSFIINQMYSKHNKSVDQCYHDYVEDWLKKPEVQQWFKDNYKSNQLAEPSEMILI